MNKHDYINENLGNEDNFFAYQQKITSKKMKFLIVFTVSIVIARPITAKIGPYSSFQKLKRALNDEFLSLQRELDSKKQQLVGVPKSVHAKPANEHSTIDKSWEILPLFK